MTPTAPELLGGCVAALSIPPAPEEMGAFSSGKVAVAVMLNMFAAQEAAQGSATRVWENAALRSVLADAASRYDLGAGPDAATDDGDYSLAALDAANAELRRRLTRLHAAAEAAGDAALDHRILALYRQMAARRMLHLPTAG